MTTREILSPLPGTFYLKPAPDAEPYFKPGDVVKEGDVVGLIEVMKMFTEVMADAGGRVVAYAQDNETPVDIGQPLLVLE